MNKKTEIKIEKAFKKKSWNEIKIADSWQIFKVMSEFVEGSKKWLRLVRVYQSLDQQEHMLTKNTTN